MENLSTNYFFDLNGYQHRTLFEGSAYPWQALSRIKSYLASFQGHRLSKIPSGTHLIDAETIWVGEGTVIEPGAYIKGPCILGRNCTVRHGAYIRGDFIAGDGCVIGHDTEVKNSIFLNGTHAAHFAYVGDSILGNDVNLGAGTICANLKLDHGEVSVKLNGKLIRTGLKKFGAIIGDRSQTGCNTVCNPGTLLGKEVFCYPCMNIGGFVASNNLIKSSHKMIVVPK